MSLVIDASLTLSWYFADETTDVNEELLSRVARTGAVVPSLWHLEVANAFQVAIRRKRIDARYRTEALRSLGQMAIEVDGETDRRAWNATLNLAETFGLTLYDAAYLELAQRRLLPLGTLDTALRRAGPALHVPILGVPR